MEQEAIEQRTMDLQADDEVTEEQVAELEFEETAAEETTIAPEETDSATTTEVTTQIESDNNSSSIILSPLQEKVNEYSNFPKFWQEEQDLEDDLDPELLAEQDREVEEFRCLLDQINQNPVIDKRPFPQTVNLVNTIKKISSKWNERPTSEKKKKKSKNGKKEKFNTNTISTPQSANIYFPNHMEMLNSGKHNQTRIQNSSSLMTSVNNNNTTTPNSSTVSTVRKSTSIDHNQFNKSSTTGSNSDNAAVGNESTSNGLTHYGVNGNFNGSSGRLSHYSNHHSQNSNFYCKQELTA